MFLWPSMSADEYKFRVERGFHDLALSIEVMGDAQFSAAVLTIFILVDRGPDMSRHGGLACPGQESDSRQRYNPPALLKGQY